MSNIEAIPQIGSRIDAKRTLINAGKKTVAVLGITGRLLLCPGDDIAATTAAIFNGVDRGGEVLGIIPEEPRLETVYDARRRAGKKK